MLYDPKWNAPTKADPLSLDSLIAWLETQPADGTYDVCNSSICLLAQWVQSIDPAARRSTTSWTYKVNGRDREFNHFIDVAIPKGDATFGTALVRARAVRDRR